jgi:hypothetical protein
MLQFGYVLDDLVNTSGNWQRHLSSISNNMPGLLMSLGAGAGLAGTLGLIYTAFVGLAPVAQHAWNAVFDPDADRRHAELKKVEEEVKSLTEAYKKLREAKTVAEESGTKSVKDLIVESGTDEVQQALLRALIASKSGATAMPGEMEPTADENRAANLAKIAHGIYGGATPETSREMAAKRVKARIDADNLARVNEVMVGSQEGGARGANARKLFEQLVGSAPDQFRPGFLGDLEASNPAAIKAQQKLEEQGQANTRAWEVKQKQKKEFSDAVKASEIEGARIEQEAARKKRETDQATAHAASQRFAEEQRKGHEADQVTKLNQAEIKRSSASARAARIADTAAQVSAQNEHAAGGFSQDSVARIAKGANDLFEKGLNQGREITAAVEMEMQRQIQLGNQSDILDRRAAQLRQNMGRNQMGADHSGDFSFIPPAW